MGSSAIEKKENAKHRRAVAEYARKQERQADALAFLQLRTHEAGDDRRCLIKVNVKVRWATVGDILIILATDGERGPEVAFGQGDELIDALVATANRWANGQLTWREDTYAKQAGGA